MNLIHTALEEAGLTIGEEKVYLCLLSNGSSSVVRIKEKTQLHRTTIYDFLESLGKKGLVSSYIDGKKRLYSAAHPTRFRDLLEEKQEAIEKILPHLSALEHTHIGGPRIEVFRGKEGLKTVIRKTADNPKNPYYVLGAVAQFETILPFFMQHLLTKIEKSRVEGFILLNSHDVVTKTRYEKYRRLPNHALTPTSFLIKDDWVAQFIWEEPYCSIFIQNKAVAESYLTYFKGLWDSSQPLTQAEFKKLKNVHV